MTGSHFEELLQKARSGELEAWNVLIAFFQPKLSLGAKPIISACRGKFDPEDLIQETFLIAVRELNQFRGKTPAEFFVWLRQIFASRVSHAVRQFVSTQSRNVARELPIMTADDSSLKRAHIEPVCPGTSPSMQAVKAEEMIRIDHALSRMPEIHRNILIWRERESLPFAEIAARLGRTENAVRKLWSRALVTLQELLSTHESPSSVRAE